MCSNFGAAARLNRSLIARPSPSRGIGITAIRVGATSSNARSIANKFAAASTKLPDGLRLNCVLIGVGPNPNRVSPSFKERAFNRNGVEGA